MRTITPILLQSDPWTPRKDIDSRVMKTHDLGEDSKLHKALVNLVELDRGRSSDKTTKHVLHMRYTVLDGIALDTD